MSCSMCENLIRIEGLTLPDQNCPHRFCYDCIQRHVQYRNCCPHCHRGIHFIQKVNCDTGCFVGGVEYVTTPEHDAQVTPHRSQLTPRTRRLVYGQSPEPAVSVTPLRPQITPIARRLNFEETDHSRATKRKLTYSDNLPSPKHFKSSLECSILDTSASLFSPVHLEESMIVCNPPENYNDFLPDLTSTRMVAENVPDTSDDFIPILSSTMNTETLEFNLVCMYLGY